MVTHSVRDPLDASEEEWLTDVLNPAIDNHADAIEALQAASGGTLPSGVKTLMQDYAVNPSGTAASQTTAIQDALDDHATWGTLIVDGEGFEINALLDFPSGVLGKRLIGVSRERSIIQQATNNTGVLRLNGSCHSLELANLHLTWASQQAASSTNAIALQYTGANFDTLYWSSFRNLRLSNAFRAVSITGSSVALPVWGNHWDHCVFDHLSGAALNIVSPTATGHPTQVFTNCQIFGATGGTVPSEGAINSVGAELLFNGLDVEDWVDYIFWAFGGGTTTIHNLHVERNTWTHAQTRMAVLTDLTTLRVIGGNIQGTSNPSGGALMDIFDMLDVSRLVAEDIGWNITVSGGTATFVTAAAGASVYLRNNYAIAGSGTVSYPSSVSGAIKQVL